MHTKEKKEKKKQLEKNKNVNGVVVVNLLSRQELLLNIWNKHFIVYFLGIEFN